MVKLNSTTAILSDLDGVILDIDYDTHTWQSWSNANNRMSKPITDSPDTIINTSCEHMSTLWYDSVDSDQLIIMQTNNSPEFEGHINICESIDDMINKYPLSNTLYIGELITPAYTRYMQIGYK